MKKNFFKMAGVACVMLPSMFFLTACGGGEEQPSHSHNFAQTWSYNDTHHYYECDGCEELSGKVEHSFGAWTNNGENHKRTCACGKEDTASHNYGTSLVEVDATQHKRVCGDCGHEVFESHSFANAIEDCACGAHAPMETINMTYCNPECNAKNSSLFYAELGKKYVFELTTGSEMWGNRVLKVEPYDTNNPNDNSDNVNSSHYTLKLYDSNKVEIDLSQRRDGVYILGVERNTTYYVVLEFTSLEDWTNEATNPNHGVCIEFSDMDKVVLFANSSNNSSASVVKYVATDVPTGTKVFMKPIVNNNLVLSNAVVLKKLNTTTGGLEAVGAPNYEYVENEGFYLTVEKGATYYISSMFGCCSLKNVKFIAENEIDTCRDGVSIKNSGDVETTANQTRVFGYTANSLQTSDVTISVLDNEGTFFSDNSIYSLEVYRVGTDRVFRDITDSFVWDEECWEYTGSSLKNSTLFILVTFHHEKTFQVAVSQIDTMLVQRDIKDGELEGSTTSVRVKYGSTYSTNPIDFGVPTKSGYDFKGWQIENKDGDLVLITGPDGKFTGTWKNTEAITYWSENKITISASYETIIRTVTLHKNGGDWSVGSGDTKSLLIIQGNTITNYNKPTKTGCVFMGYYSELENGICLISANLNVLDLDSLTNTTNNYYTLYARWATSLPTCSEVISVPANQKGYYAITTENWTLPTGETTAPTRIELTGMNMESYIMVVYDRDNNVVERITEGENVYNLKPATQYFLKIYGNGSTQITDETLVIEREL